MSDLSEKKIVKDRKYVKNVKFNTCQRERDREEGLTFFPCFHVLYEKKEGPKKSLDHLPSQVEEEREREKKKRERERSENRI